MRAGGSLACPGHPEDLVRLPVSIIDPVRLARRASPAAHRCHLLGVEPRLCLALEDSYNGVRSAFAAGMMTIMVPDLLEPTVEIRDLCVHVAQDLHEVGRLILR